MAAETRNPFVVATLKCAAPGCSKLRKQANHWFLTSEEQDTFACRPYSLGDELSVADMPVCGQACAQRLFERFLAKKAL
jgi:hypothetical protein